MTEERVLVWIQTLGLPTAALGLLFWWLKPWAEKLMQGHLEFLKSADECQKKNTDCLEKNTECLVGYGESFKRIERVVERHADLATKIDRNICEQSHVMRSVQQALGQRT